MRIRVQQVTVPLESDDAAVVRRLALKLGCAPDALAGVRVVRRSLDARPRNPQPVYVLTVEANYLGPALPEDAARLGVERIPDEAPEALPVPLRTRPGAPRPIVVGAGPSGLLAAYELALAGAQPLLIERGDEAQTRAPHVARFWQDGTLDPESNVLFGEGGAGLFSDGKLTARSKERGRIARFLHLLHACGAPARVLVDAEPHVGSDVLLRIVPEIRARIVAAGGEVRFRTRLERLVIESGRLRAVIANGAEIACDQCVLAVGHSARDVYAHLSEAGVALAPKPFAVGVRLEIPQAAIDRAQYGRFAGNPQLGAASFRLTRRESGDVRACYSFCMCPGGRVICCASEPGLITTNGMSYSGRALPGGNAAFLVPVGPADYPEHAVPALAGLAFQRELEHAAFTAAGGGYRVPAMRLVDFLARRPTPALPADRSCGRATSVDLGALLPACVTHTLRHAIPAMLRELNGVRPEDALLYAPETRSSSPLWILRGDTCEAVATAGLYPAGEGGGYAGGIVSAAIDGMRAAGHLLAALRAG